MDCKAVKSHRFILGIVLIGISGCSISSDNQGQFKHMLTLEEASVSIKGDDSFVTSRFYRKFYNRYYEVLTFQGGFLSYEKGYAGQELIPALYEQNELVRQFNKYKPAKNRGISVSEDDVDKQNNIYGPYVFASKGNSWANCILTLQYFGTATQTNSPGDQKVRAGACWTKSKGRKEELEAFVHDLMSRVRFDGGAINKAKAALSESTPQAQRSTSVPPGFERYQSIHLAYDFRAFAINTETDRWSRSYHKNSPKRAIDSAINTCERTGEECTLYALGDTLVEGRSPEQIAKVARDYYAAVSPLMAIADFTKFTGKRLSSEEILEHLSNSVVEVVTYNNLKYRGRWQSNGTMSATATHQIGIENDTADSGTWSVSDDKLCRQWRQWLGGRHECLVVTKDGSTLRAYDIHGDTIETIELVGKTRGSQQES